MSYEEELKKLSENDKIKFINSIPNEKIRFDLLKNINQDSAKVNVIKSLNDQLKIQSLEMLSDENYKTEIIKMFEGEEVKVNLLSKLENDYKKFSIIKDIKDEQLRFKSIKFFKDESLKIQILNTITDDSLKIQALPQFKDEYNKVTIINSLKNELDRYNQLINIKDEDKKIQILNTITDDGLKIQALTQFENENNKLKIIKTIKNVEMLKIVLVDFDDTKKLDVINNLENEFDRLKLLDLFEVEESKFIIISNIKNLELKNNGLKLLNDYENIMLDFFKHGKFENLYSFGVDILNNIFEEKQINILNEYSKIDNQSIRDIYSGYIITNYESIDINNINKIAGLLHEIEVSNSSEIKRFKDTIANQALKQENPITYFKQVEKIFIENNLPNVGKAFEVFKLLHTTDSSYYNFSPMLNKFNQSKNRVKMYDLIIFNDLLKCSFGSNNRSLKNYLNDIKKGNELLIGIIDNNKGIETLNDMEKECLTIYLDKLEVLLNGYDSWKLKKQVYRRDNDLLSQINEFTKRLSVSNNNFKDLPDILIKKLCGVSGIDSFDKAQKYIKYVVDSTNQRNIYNSNKPFTLEVGDFVKGINSVKYLTNILQNGSVAKEYLGDDAGSDLTPLDTDLSRILDSNIIGKKNSELGRIINSTISGSYGSTYIVLKNDPNKIEVTRDNNNQIYSSNSSKFSKLEAFKTFDGGHYGIRTGFPSSDIDYIVSKDNFDIIGLEIAINGFYIPVVDINGNLVYKPEDYQNLREKMNGLSYYEMGEYKVDNSINIVNNELLELYKDVRKKSNTTEKISNLINSIIREGVSKLNLSLTDKINLNNGSVTLINTGSTGRFTNLPGEGDYDFIMQVDRKIFDDESKMKELRKNILEALDKENKSNFVSIGNDIREFKAHVIDDNGQEHLVEIDITFVTKTDKTEYSTDVCVLDRLNNITSDEKKNMVKTNIVLAKKFLKEINAYKPSSKDSSQGGMGGIGIENWILQNGGTLYNASKTFVESANECKNFDEFKKVYKVYNFGINHMADKKGVYPHNNFIDNMNAIGFNKMLNALKLYMKLYEQKSEIPCLEAIKLLNNDNYDLEVNNNYVK